MFLVSRLKDGPTALSEEGLQTGTAFELKELETQHWCVPLVQYMLYFPDNGDLSDDRLELSKAHLNLKTSFAETVILV